MPDKVKNYEYLKIPAYIVGAITAIVILLGAFGFDFQTPGAKWEDHDDQHVVEMEIHEEQFQKIDIALENIDEGMMEQQTLFEAVIIGDCMDRTKEQLELQRLIPTCTELGIDKN